MSVAVTSLPRLYERAVRVNFARRHVAIIAYRENTRNAIRVLRHLRTRLETGAAAGGARVTRTVTK